ncbi:uncharacterized protein LOC114248997 [Bombyx mandarina]|uniref:THAP-type domain-containing protein n=2 Tax=Bombyx TaxID=7090 RepID=A0A8R2AH16_BOMMO|nr:uncharacterized protein LOC101744553 [Bombyx mori]XP_028038253.1 uncharacterized protein LOC114248997 [Bombyx mandarina]
MGYYCTVPQCTSLAGKTKNVKFHKFPKDKTMEKRWNEILKRGKPVTIYSKVCSLHFTQADYNITTMGQWKTLNKDAVPSQNLPKLNPDGSVMVIRKSRTVKYKETKKHEMNGEKSERIWGITPQNHGQTNMNPDLPLPCTEQDINLSCKMQYVTSLASEPSPPQLRTQPPPARPKKQDAIMQTDPVPSDEEPRDSYADCLPYKDDYIPQTNEEYNTEAEKYALERKSHYEKTEFLEKYRSDLYYPDSVEMLKNQQQNLQLLQDERRMNGNQGFFNEAEIKQEIDIPVDDEKYLYERKDMEAEAVYSDSQRQIIIEHIQNQVKQEPDLSNGCENVCLQPQSSPYYQNGHNDVNIVYYDQVSRPGPELLIAKQNALAAHTQLWQNTVKRPFFYSENSHYTGSQLLHRYEDLTRILQ